MKKGTILLIEDDKILAKVVTEELSEAGYQMYNAYDGVDGLKMIKSKKPDLVLCDILMPKKNGFEVLEEAKASPDLAEIPVIMMTMLGSDEDIKKGLKLGAEDYIVKSQHPVGEIIEKIEDFFGSEQHPQSKAKIEKPKAEEEDNKEKSVDKKAVKKSIKKK